MRFTGPAIIMWTIGALLSIVLGVHPVLAACTDDSQCSSGFRCRDSLFTGKECVGFSCNADSECPSDAPSCTGGICRAPASGGSGGGGGAGIPQSGVGQACGQVKIGQVTKARGCKPGLQCVKVPASSISGTCQKPPS